MKKFMISFNFWNLWFGWSQKFMGDKNTFFFRKLTIHRSFGIEVTFRDI